MPGLRVGENDLKTKNPLLSKEWHPTKNENLKPHNVAEHSPKKVWWLGKCGHEWNASVSKRSKGRGCPYCSNNKVLVGFNDLSSKYPEIAKEWDYSKNGSITPEMISPRSNKKVWWIDSLGHQWQTTPDKRTSRNQYCPFCSGSKLLEGFNDLKVTHPKLVEEWSPKNTLKYNDPGVRNLSKILWLGSCGHEWEAVLENRKYGSGCLVCTNKVVKNDVNSFAFTNPTLFEEWDFNKNKDVSPYEVPAGTNKKVWWIGKCGHSWLAAISKRVSGKGCAVCAGRQVQKGVNDLHTVAPNLSAEFHPALNGKLTAGDLVANSHTKVWWLGSCGHEWRADPHHRMNGVGCPICAGKQIVIGFNDLASQFPKIASEWNILRNGSLTIYDFTSKSSKKVWWQCSQGHEYQTTVASRTSRGTGCSQCIQASTSKIQQAFHQELSKLISDLQCDIRIPVSFKTRASMSVDMLSEALKVAIEYDGYYYHSGGRSGRSMASHINHDIAKTQALVGAGYRVVRIRENGLPHLKMNTDKVLEIDYQYGDSMESTAKKIIQFGDNK